MSALTSLRTRLALAIHPAVVALRRLRTLLLLLLFGTTRLRLLGLAAGLLATLLLATLGLLTL